MASDRRTTPEPSPRTFANGGEGQRLPHILSVALEDYYHKLDRVIQRSHWHRFEARVEQSTHRTLDLLDELGISTTFFALGWVASTLPELIREVARRGHEIGSKGYHQRNLRELSPAEFRDDLARAREALESASGQRVEGYRAPGWLEPTDVWALDVLAEEGYRYDSSVKPLFLSHRPSSYRRFAHEVEAGGRTLWEFPISTISLGGLLIPVGAGNYFRQLPEALTRRAVAYWDRRYDAPFNMYFHTWELDPEQPQIAAASAIDRIRLYRNLDKAPFVLRRHLARYRFTGIGNYLALSGAIPATLAPRTAAPSARDTSPAVATEPPVVVQTAPARDGARAPTREPNREPTPVTVVVPCYNEEHSLPYLANTLRGVETTMASDYELHYVFVNDHSTDDTANTLQRLFGDWPRCTIVHHERNHGPTAAILTGLRRARTEVVASIDCDCTYDPYELQHMLPLLTEDVDLVTGSPYHPDGRVRNVPEWRLVLSKSASMLYRMVLRQKIGTYTSFFRVYRRSVALKVDVQHGGFLGIAEMIGKLDLAGSRIVEYPTTLEVRLLGYSKMKLTRLILGHLALITRLAAQRLAGPPPRRRVRTPSPTPSVESVP